MLQSLCVMIGQMQCTTEMIILTYVVVDEVRVEVHLKPAPPIGH